jgi:signal transduction histidine kinase
MLEFLTNLFNADFMPHGGCMRWDRQVVWLHLISDAFIALAYYSIPVALVYFIRRRRDLAFQNVFVWFCAFIFACGTTHLMSVWTLYDPVYRLEGVIKAVTALVSVYTAFLLWPLIPRALALPSPSQLEAANRELAFQIHERRQAEERIRQMNTELERRVAERTEELQRSTQETQARNAEIEQFIYTVSHDLKSPLVTVQGFAGLLERDLREGRTDRLAEFTEQIKSGVAQMAELIDDLLNLSRVGRIMRPPEPVDFSDLARKILRLHYRELEASHIHVEVQEGLPTIHVDKERIAEVIENVISNAIKYGGAAESPRIEIGGEVVDDEVRFFVRDNGPGIPERYHKKIFDLFERLDTSTEGTGVGLTIVRRAMEVHGGRVWVESAPGQGTVIWLAFPASVLMGPVEPGDVKD